VKYFDWDDAKNAKLRANRGIGFEDIVFHIDRGDVLAILGHPNRVGDAEALTTGDSRSLEQYGACLRRTVQEIEDVLAFAAMRSIASR
jgi:hypothetical protein